MPQKIEYKHGAVMLANLNPNKGKEPGKIRPVLVLQNQELLNISHPTTIIIPFSTKLIDDAEPLRIRVEASGNLKQDSDLLIDQLRAISNQRLIGEPLMHCDHQIMQKVYDAVLEVLGVTINKSTHWKISESPVFYEIFDEI